MLHSTMSGQVSTGLSKDMELVQAASASLQAHEELCHIMKENLKDVPQAKKGRVYCNIIFCTHRLLCGGYTH